MKSFEFPNGMTVADLKELITYWPDEDEDGEPCEVWFETGNCLSKPVRTATPLNQRKSEDGEFIWADLLFN